MDGKVCVVDCFTLINEMKLKKLQQDFLLSFNMKSLYFASKQAKMIQKINK